MNTKNIAFLQFPSHLKNQFTNNHDHSQKKNPTRCSNVSQFFIYMKLNMFRAIHRPSSGAYNCTSSFWLWIRGELLDV